MLASIRLMENVRGDKTPLMITPPAEAMTAARWSYRNVPSKSIVNCSSDGRLHGKDSGDGPYNDLDALADFSVHRNVESVCLCAANGTDSSRL